MIDFQRLRLSQREQYESILMAAPGRGCEYSFANLFLWGRQEAAFLHGCVAFFSHFYGRSVYPYPIGPGDRRAVVGEILRDAEERGIPCRITNMTEADRAELEGWFPGTFLLRSDRNSFDYVYAIDDLAELKGRKFQKKRNHVNRFWAEHGSARVEPLSEENRAAAQCMVNEWYLSRMDADPEGNYMLENIALTRAFQNLEALGLEALVLMEEGRALGLTMGSRLSPDTFDIHFEKAREDAEGAYAAINRAFARYLREKHPDLQYLDREDDLGLEGLRRAKLSYNPHHMIEKFWAYRNEDFHED